MTPKYRLLKGGGQYPTSALNPKSKPQTRNPKDCEDSLSPKPQVFIKLFRIAKELVLSFGNPKP